jgi:hypothetical protein
MLADRFRDRAEDDAGLGFSSSLKVVTTDTESNTASTPPLPGLLDAGENLLLRSGMPSFS